MVKKVGCRPRLLKTWRQYDRMAMMRLLHNVEVGLFKSTSYLFHDL